MDKIELYKGKTAYVEFVTDDDTSYIIRAYIIDDENKRVEVGSCYFDIERFYQRKLRDEERLAKAQYFGGIMKTPETSEILVRKRDEHKYNIKGHTLIFKTKGRYEKFPLKFAKCHLEFIQVTHIDYLKVGLGTAMLKIMKQFALMNKCYEIYAHFQPYGMFANCSRTFYKKNGFSFDYDAHEQKSYVTLFLPNPKDLTKVRTPIQSKTTPTVQAKYAGGKQ